MQNDLIIESHRLEFFYKRLVKKSNFDLTHLAKLVTSCRRESIIDSTTVKVDGMSSEHRRTKPLIEQNPNPTEAEARYFLAGNICRCTGYDKIIRAVLDAAATMRGAA